MSVKSDNRNPSAGAHGFDPAILPEMKGNFRGGRAGYSARSDGRPFENVNVYPLIAKILGLDTRALKTGPIDGKLAVLQGILKNPD